MKITKLGGVFDDGIQALSIARKWILDHTGVDMGIVEIIPCEVLEIDGRLFYRQKKETAFYRLPAWPAHPDGDIVCECGCFKFYVYLEKITCSYCSKSSSYHDN